MLPKYHGLNWKDRSMGSCRCRCKFVITVGIQPGFSLHFLNSLVIHESSAWSKSVPWMMYVWKSEKNNYIIKAKFYFKKYRVVCEVCSNTRKSDFFRFQNTSKFVALQLVFEVLDYYLLYTKIMVYCFTKCIGKAQLWTITKHIGRRLRKAENTFVLHCFGGNV